MYEVSVHIAAQESEALGGGPEGKGTPCPELYHLRSQACSHNLSSKHSACPGHSGCTFTACRCNDLAKHKVSFREKKAPIIIMILIIIISLLVLIYIYIYIFLYNIIYVGLCTSLSVIAGRPRPNSGRRMRRAAPSDLAPPCPRRQPQVSLNASSLRSRLFRKAGFTHPRCAAPQHHDGTRCFEELFLPAGRELAQFLAAKTVRHGALAGGMICLMAPTIAFGPPSLRQWPPSVLLGGPPHALSIL